MKNNSSSPKTYLLLLVLAISLSGCAGMRQKSKVEIIRDLPYGSGYTAETADAPPVLRPLLLDIVRLEKRPKTPQPAIVIVHGGSFEKGSKENEQQRLAAHQLAQKGYVCFLINYRLMQENAPAPANYPDPLLKSIHAAVVDAKTALRHVCANAETYHVDPGRIALMGDSAGAIISLAAGLSAPDKFSDDGPGFPVPPENHPGVEARVAAIVNLWGTADYFPELFGPKSPPIMSVHGGQDYRVGFSLMPALNIDALCKKYQIPHYFYPVPDAGHGAWDAVIEDKTLAELIASFLEREMAGS